MSIYFVFAVDALYSGTKGIQRLWRGTGSQCYRSSILLYFVDLALRSCFKVKRVHLIFLGKPNCILAVFIHQGHAIHKSSSCKTPSMMVGEHCKKHKNAIILSEKKLRW